MNFLEVRTAWTSTEWPPQPNWPVLTPEELKELEENRPTPPFQNQSTCSSPSFPSPPPPPYAMLLEHSIQNPSSDLLTDLLDTVTRQDHEALKQLLEKVERQGDEGLNNLKKALSSSDREGNTLLHSLLKAVPQDSFHTLFDLLIFLGKSAPRKVLRSQDDEGNTVVHLLVKNLGPSLVDKDSQAKLYQFVCYLVSKGASLTLQNTNYQTPVELIPINQLSIFLKEKKSYADRLIQLALDTLVKTDAIMQEEAQNKRLDGTEIHRLTMLAREGYELGKKTKKVTRMIACLFRLGYETEMDEEGKFPTFFEYSELVDYTSKSN